MEDLSKTEREFYESQTKEQLMIFLLNAEHREKLLRKKLAILTGCPCFGDCDSMDGSCVDCYYDNPDLQNQCSRFQGEFIRMLKNE